MKFEYIKTYNFENALRGMRNPKESWNKMDSYYSDINYIIGKNDLFLAKTLIKAGREHRKFLRQIFVSVDITGPLYWWKEFDSYKVGVVANSTSTMHKICDTKISIDCFELDEISNYNIDELNFIINTLENYRKKFIETKEIKYWRMLIQLLPSAWLQKRSVTMNYENLFCMCEVGQRRYHKLREWSSDFMTFVSTLPYSNEFIFNS